MNGQSLGSAPILCAHLLRRVDEKLVELLGSLEPSEWDLQTIAPLWKVRDVAAHLLDTVLRKLSMVRDSCYVEAVNVRSAQDVIALVNRLNAEGVTVYRRLSPPILIDMMKAACQQSARFHESLDPFAPARFAVSWAGEETSLNWFDTARELTERWHHQQQIRLAVNKPGIMTREFYCPVLDCFLRALPFAYGSISAKPGTYVQIIVSGECGSSWYLYRAEETWQLLQEPCGDRASETTIPQEIAWRIFTKGIDRESALGQIKIAGDTKLGQHVLGMLSIVA